MFAEHDNDPCAPCSRVLGSPSPCAVTHDFRPEAYPGAQKEMGAELPPPSREDLLAALTNILRCGQKAKGVAGGVYNAPGHAHLTPGLWDDSGKPCEWCAAWRHARELAGFSVAEAVVFPHAATYRDAQEAIGLLRSLANDARTHGMAAELEEMADRVAEMFP